MSWSDDSSVYKVAFLVGDAPPHMDYQNDAKYPTTLNAAAKTAPLNLLGRALLRHGAYFQVWD